MKLHSVVDNITNSSSTTFIVGFEATPETEGQMFNLLFPKGEEVLCCYDEGVPSRTVAKIVFEDLKTAKKIKDKSEFIEVYGGGWFEEYPDFDDESEYPEMAKLEEELRELDKKYRQEYGKEASSHDHPEWQDNRLSLYRQKFDLASVARDEAAEQGANKRWKNFKDLELFVFSYSDNDGTTGMVMEHGGTFEALPHVAINNH